MKAFIKDYDLGDGVERNFWGYDILFPYKEVGYGVTDVALDYMYYRRAQFFEHDIKSLYQDITPAKGSKINVIPTCPLPFEDIRKNYTIKRGYDTGDYNVFSEPNLNSYDYCYYSDFILLDNIKTIIVYSGSDIRRSPKVLSDTLDSLGVSNSDGMWVNAGQGLTFYFQVCSLPEAWYKLLTGTLAKPAIYYKSLDLSNSNIISLQTADDFITTVLGLDGSNKGWSEMEEQLSLQIQAMNQLDWRTRLGTMTIIFNILFNKSEVFRSMSCHISKYPKSVRWFFSEDIGHHKYSTEKLPVFSSTEDFELALGLVQKRLNLGDKKLTTKPVLEKKLLDAGISFETFSELYSTTVRLVAKDYEAETSNTTLTVED